MTSVAGSVPRRATRAIALDSCLSYEAIDVLGVSLRELGEAQGARA